MNKNLFGRDISRLGFGCMRLPEGQDGEYIEEEIREMFAWAMDHGINYFDSAWHYIESQMMIGKYLTPYYPRESFVLVGKLFFNDGTLNTWEKAEAAFQKELTDAKVEYNDLELIHSMGSDISLQRLDAMDAWGFMRSLKESGRARHIGISFHGPTRNLEKVLKEHPEIEVVQIQANYYDHYTESRYANGGGRDVYETCRRYGKPVIIMEPVKGGGLAQVDRHPEIRQLFETTDPSQSPASFALRYAASLEGVVTVLSGMSNMQQLCENRRILLEEFRPLSEAERSMLREAAEIIEGKGPVGCTACGYCMDKGCPAKIRIPEILKSLNALHQYQDMRWARKRYYDAVTAGSRPTECLDCSSCERECPQGLPVRKLIREADDQMWAGENYDVWANH